MKKVFYFALIAFFVATPVLAVDNLDTTIEQIGNAVDTVTNVNEDITNETTNSQKELEEQSQHLKEPFEQTQQGITDLERQIQDEIGINLDSMNVDQQNVEKGLELLGKFATVVLIVVAIAFLVALAGFIFNIVMIIDCANHENENKSVWLVLLVAGLFLGIGAIVSLVYFFVVKKKRNEIPQPENSKSAKKSKLAN